MSPYYCMDCGRKQSKKVRLKTVNYLELGEFGAMWPKKRTVTVGHCRKCKSRFIHRLGVAEGDACTFGMFCKVSEEDAASPTLRAVYIQRGSGPIGKSFAHAYAAVKRELVGRLWRHAHREGDGVACSSYITVGLAPWGPAEAFR